MSLRPKRSKGRVRKKRRSSIAQNTGGKSAGAEREAAYLELLREVR
jgi:hypothetical protein